MTQSIIATIFSWTGILGGALTVFSNLDSLIKLSGWARWITSHWQEWMTVLWGGYLGLSNMTVDTDLVLVDAPFLGALVLIAIASRFMSDDTATVPPRRVLYSLHIGAAAFLALCTTVVVLFHNGYPVGESVVSVALMFAGFWLVMFLMVSHWPYHLAAASALGALILFGLLFAVRPEPQSVTEVEYARVVVRTFLYVVPLAALIVFVAKPEPFTRSLWLLLVCLIVLVGLNAISGSQFDLTPPTS
jgi:hypothetical protein